MYKFDFNDTLTPDSYKKIRFMYDSLFKLAEPENIKIFIAGGAIRDLLLGAPRPRDIDIYFTDEKSFNNFAGLLKKKYYSSRIRNTKNSEVFDMKKGWPNIDLVKIEFFPTPEHVIQSFDFTVCCCAMDKDAMYIHNDFFTDLLSRQLRENNFVRPNQTLMRLVKFLKRGFNVSPETLNNLGKAINNTMEYPDLTLQELAEFDWEKTVNKGSYDFSSNQQKLPF